MITMETREHAEYSLRMVMLMAMGVMPLMQQYIKILEKIYINNRTLQDMTEQGRQA